MFKKSFIILLNILLIISLSAGLVTANERNNVKAIENGKIIFNEYKALKKLQEKSEKELLKEGYKEEEIRKLKTFNYSDILKERAKLDKQQLESMGYTEDRITMLRNFSGTENEIVALASTVIMNATTDNFYYGNNRTDWDVYFNWQWTSMPAFTISDIIAIRWAPNLFPDGSTSFHKVIYKDVTGYGSDITLTKPLKWNPGVGVSSSFEMVQPNNAWAYYGYGVINLYNSGELHPVAMDFAYGHSTYTATPSVTYPWGGGFTFSSTVSEEGSGYYLQEDY